MRDGFVSSNWPTRRVGNGRKRERAKHGFHAGNRSETEIRRRFLDQDVSYASSSINFERHNVATLAEMMRFDTRPQILHRATHALPYA